MATGTVDVGDTKGDEKTLMNVNITCKLYEIKRMKPNVKKI